MASPEVMGPMGSR
uniref:Uncharacterized protein n=1 Tax=Parastrongyloides trichosuri TaxID=131310 RepID=A0A0N4Z9H7_PARTI